MTGFRWRVVLPFVFWVACGGGATSEDAGASIDTGMRDAGSDASAADAGSDASAADAGSDASAADAGSRAMIWRPDPGSTWYWQLSGTIDRSHDVDVYDIDLFDMTDADVTALKSRGIKLICYFSAGSFEDWRSDADDFPAAALGNPLDGWPGERWLDHRDPGVRAVMSARLDLAVARGCDGVEPDNVDAWDNDPGFPLTRDDQIDYVRWLAAQAHERGLSVGLKNAVDILLTVIGDFDWVLNEQCVQFDECDAYLTLTDGGFAIFHVEYQGSLDSFCDRVPSGFSSVRANIDLDGSRWDGCWER